MPTLTQKSKLLVKPLSKNNINNKSLRQNNYHENPSQQRIILRLSTTLPTLAVKENRLAPKRTAKMKK
jgi:hypothetical protein